MFRYKDVFTSKKYFYTVGYDFNLRSYFLSILVSKLRTDYDEYYYITEEQCKIFSENEEEGRTFSNECREHKHDDKLMIAPGQDQGY